MSYGGGRRGRRGGNKWRGKGGGGGAGPSMGAFESRDIVPGNLPSRPPGLKGKAIGLFYRDRQKNRRNIGPVLFLLFCVLLISIIISSILINNFSPD